MDRSQSYNAFEAVHAYIGLVKAGVVYHPYVFDRAMELTALGELEVEVDVTNEVVMRELTKMCLQQATQDLAKFARRFADEVPSELTAKQAMLAFADAIENTNGKVWPKSAASA